MTSTPLDNGFYMPAEWEKHEGTWLQWPHDDTRKDNQLRLEHIWLAMTKALHENETVHIVVQDEQRKQHLEKLLTYYGFDKNNIDVRIIPTDDVWVRDNGPIFLVNDRGELAVTDWRFNGWGDRYSSMLDGDVPEKIAEILSLPIFTSPIVLEGGGIEVNGKGTLIATRSSIINPNRNPGKTQGEIEETLKQYLGIRHVIWLSGVRGLDDTDFHVDVAARFVDESTVLYTWTEDESNHLHQYLETHLKELQGATNESGKPLKLIPLPTPENQLYSTRDYANTSFKAMPIVSAYTNFYVANNVVLVPVYGDVNDAVAKKIIAKCFPSRNIAGIHAQFLAELGGMIHCVTQQQPSL